MPKKHPGAVQLGKLGGKARSKKLSKKQRKEIARLGGPARWKRTEGTNKKWPPGLAAGKEEVS